MDFQEYFKKMCGDPDEVTSTKFKVNGSTTPFNKKELRWLKDQLESSLSGMIRKRKVSKCIKICSKK